MTRLKLFTALTLSSICTFATASIDEFQNSTTCYIFKNSRLTQQSKCNFTANVGSSSTYTVNEYTYHVPKVGKIKTVDNFFDGYTNSHSEVIFKSEIHTLNGKKSIGHVRNAKTFKIYTDKQLNADPSLRNAGLECAALKDNSLEICTPPNNFS